MRFTSSKSVIARVQRYINGNSWLAAAYMSLGDAIQEIGYATQADATKEDELVTISNHTGEIPCDAEFIRMIHHEGCRLPVTKDVTIHALDCDDYTWGKNGTGDYYQIVYPYIKTSFESGTVKVFYDKFNTDEEGFVNIPDEAEYRRACMWYVLADLILEGYKLNDKSISHGYAMSQFDSYKNKARSKVNEFSYDEREAFSRMWNSLNTQNVEQLFTDIQ